MASFKNIIRKKITWGDLDALGIVFYPKFYEWIDEASHIFFDKIGLNLGRLLKEKGIIFALIETGARYIKPGRYHDEIEIISYIKEISEKTILLDHKIRHFPDKKLLVEGYEKRICIQVLSQESNFKAIPIPKDLKSVLDKYK